MPPLIARPGFAPLPLPQKVPPVGRNGKRLRRDVAELPLCRHWLGGFFGRL